MAINTEQGNTLSLWERVYEDLYRQIDDFEFGERFYTISEICTKYDVSAITATRVLTEMENAGLVRKVQKRGTIVNNTKEKFVVRLVLPKDVQIERTIVQFRLYKGIMSEASKKNVDVEIISEDSLISSLLPSKQKIGFFVLFYTNETFLKFCKKNNFPFVVLHAYNTDKDTATVSVDRKWGGYLATKHLASLGHKRISLITGSNFTDALNLPLFKGYQNALKEMKIRFDWELIQQTSPDNPQENYDVLRKLLSLSSPPTAIITRNDFRAIHMLNYCSKNGIDVPQDLSVIGYDNIHDSSLTAPPLTTIDTKLEAVGAHGVNLLLNMMAAKNKKRWKNIVVKPDIVIRMSTGQPSAG